MNFFRLLITLTAAVTLITSARAASRPVRLNEILALRFRLESTGSLMADVGVLNASGGFRVIDRTPFPTDGTVAPEALRGFVIPGQAWFSYSVLGSQALDNFKIGSPVIFIGEQGFFPVAAADAPKGELGELGSISTRATVTPGADPVIAGFVVEGKPRRFLIRGVGPTLRNFAVTAPLADPLITLFRSGSAQALAANDDWAQQADAEAIKQAAVTAGAFPLAANSKDAAYLVELEPGAYTVHLSTPGNTSGTALLEVYSLP